MKIQPVRGTKDLLFDEAELYEYIVSSAIEIFKNYNYKPIYTPIFEFAEVFKRSLGDYSDVVSKEMYEFKDKSDESLTLRPEFTASIIRAMISNGLYQDLPLRLYSFGPLFRYERPQRGRQRQFHQLNIEALGIESAKMDAEVIVMAHHVLKKLGIEQQSKLHLNSLGCSDTRTKYTESLVQYFSKYRQELSIDSQMRLEKNPLRILDSKDQKDISLLQGAPSIEQFYTYDAAKFFNEVKEYLTLANLEFIEDKALVRGLDYYCHTAFEFRSDNLGSQSAIMGGGRYDKLSKMLGGQEVCGVGFGLGIERVALLLEKKLSKKDNINIIIPMCGASSEKLAFTLAQHLREANINALIEYDFNHKKSIKRANKINAKFAIFIGEDEIAQNFFAIKNLETGVQKNVTKNEITKYLSE